MQPVSAGVVSESLQTNDNEDLNRCRAVLFPGTLLELLKHESMQYDQPIASGLNESVECFPGGEALSL